MNKLRTFGLLLLLFVDITVMAADDFVLFTSTDGYRALPVERLTVAMDKNDERGVGIAAENLCKDFGRVTGHEALLTYGKQADIVAGTIGRSRVVDALVRKGVIKAADLKGKWEKYVIVVNDGQIIIAGSDRRGTIYGIYELSRQIGVSPWYFWGDVPTVRRQAVYVKPGVYTDGEPKVKYRGIFINDEWPSFGSWCGNRFGGINSKMYATMFELLLRLKANYLWPAMWASSFNEDDPLSPKVADEYGIVMGTSHHEPMMRAHKEYTSRRKEIGPWNYAVNKERVDKFFREGMERNRRYDNLVTIGMRGDGDVAMGNGDDEENMATLTKVIEGQRKIIKDVYGREDAVPQLWAVFTEVQRYYDAGFTVPDDVTLLFCDNNWGYIRRKAPASERNRKGGFGLYYHIDMNGGPWNDRWVNTSPLPKLREQLSLAYQSGIDRIWIVNVGDLKPKELPIDFIMNYAWNPEAIQPGDEYGYVRWWAAGIFGAGVADDVADILVKYPKYNLWRKPEVQVPGLFSVENHDEANRVTMLWRQLAEKAEAVKLRIPAEAQDAYYQLVYYPAVASACVAEIYLAATQNRYYADRLDLRANAFADRAKELYRKDSLLAGYYNKVMAGGKWNGMMQDKHIGYTKWSMQDRNILPELHYVSESEAKPSCVVESKPTDEYSIPAIRFSRNIPAGGVAWQLLPDLGRADGCMGINNTVAQPVESGSGPCLEYDIDVTESGNVKVAIGILPTQDVCPERGLRIAVQMDNGEITTLDARRGLVDTFDEYTPGNLARTKKLRPLPASGKMALNGYHRHMRNEVFDNQRWLDATFAVGTAGKHTLRVIMVDPEVVLERIVINPDDNCYSYFGAPERKDF